MKVLMMVTWYTPMGYDKLEAGVFHYEQSLSLKQYCDVAIYYPFDIDIKEDETCQEEWGIQTYRSRNTGNILKLRNRIMKTMGRIVKDFNPDIIHAHCGGVAGFFAVDAGKRYNIPVVITEHAPVEMTHVDQLSVRHFITKRAYKMSRANICVSTDLKNKLSAIYPKYNFEVINNGIIIPEYDRQKGKYYREGYLNIVIVAVLYDLEVKGLKYLLGAIRQLKEHGKNVVLHHIGAGEYLEHFMNLSKELGIDDLCVFHGRCERKKLYEIVNEMDFFVSSSLVESGGVAACEAMLLGKPVLGTNSGGVDSLVPKEAGHIVSKGSEHALADGIIYMEEHLNEFDGEWIKTYAFDSFEIDNISKKHLQLYRKIIQEEK